MNDIGRYVSPPPAQQRESLVDVLDRVLDKGVVIAGDIVINLLDIELLTVKVRLLIASVDKAKEMGIDWWQHDPRLSQPPATRAHNARDKQLEKENRELRRRIERLEARLSERGERGLPRTVARSPHRPTGE